MRLLNASSHNFLILIELVAWPKRRNMAQFISRFDTRAEICDPREKIAFLERVWLRC